MVYSKLCVLYQPKRKITLEKALVERCLKNRNFRLLEEYLDKQKYYPNHSLQPEAQNELISAAAKIKRWETGIRLITAHAKDFSRCKSDGSLRTFGFRASVFLSSPAHCVSSLVACGAATSLPNSPPHPSPPAPPHFLPSRLPLPFRPYIPLFFRGKSRRKNLRKCTMGAY